MFSSKDIFLGKGGAGGYQISRSVRLRSSASAYFNRTLTTPTNNKIWTWSAWVKKGTLTSDLYLVAAGNTTAYEIIRLSNSSSDNFEYAYWNGSAYSYQIRSTLVLRDPSAWYHIVLQVDTTQATASNRVRMYVNNVEVTSFSISSYPAQNTNTQINSAIATRIGGGFSAGAYFDGYITEINFIDGQALTPSSFGATSTTTGVWGPAKYTGTYGTNGFYLNFSDNSSNTATTIGKDSSGNGNNWTPNNISVTTGTTYDSMVDTPTPYGTDTGVGGEVRGNYWTFNPLISVAGATYSNGNLQYTNSGSNKSGFSSPLPTTGKWYWEATWVTNGGGSFPIVGLAQAGFENTQGATGELGYRANGNKFDQNATETAYGATWTTGDVIGVAVDMDAGTIAFYKNGASQGTAFTTVLTALTQPVSPMFRVNVAGDVLVFNFGQRPFANTAPSGYKALNTQNLSTPTIANGASYMAATLYTGNGAAGQSVVNTVNGVSFAPDFAWVKVRSTAGTDHYLADTVRGATKYLQSDTTAAEGTNNGITAFNSNGFSVGAVGDTNTNGATIVGWNWKAGGTAVSNTSGSITSSVSANSTAGFSIVTYTGTGANATIGHGLGVAPKMVIAKSRSASTTVWPTYHVGLTSASYSLELQSTAAQTNIYNAWNSTAPSSSVVSIGTPAGINTNGATYVMYCFAPIAGYSAFGTYTGNGSADGPFVYTGFRPRFILTKRYDGGANVWSIVDTSRNTYNAANAALYPNTSDAESTVNYTVDINSNGFKFRSTSSDVNLNGGTYIYAAFAENSFKFSLAR